MESSDNRRQSESSLPSINYMGFEQAAREGSQFRQRHPSSTARPSISAASPISPTTQFGPHGHTHPFPPPSSTTTPNGYVTPPESRKNSDNQRQSLPSIHEALFDKPGSFSAPSPLQTPPIGSGSFSVPPPPPSRTNSMPRSQPSESQQSSSHPPPPPPPQPAPQPYPLSHPPPPPPPQPTPGPAHSQESAYSRQDTQMHMRTLPPNPYSNSQPPPPSIPPMQASEPYHPPAPAPPPPLASQSQPSPAPPLYQSHPGYPSAHQVSSPHYPPTPSYPSVSSGPPATGHYNSYPQHPQSSFPPQSAQPPYQYPPRDSAYVSLDAPSTGPQLSPGNKGIKRSGSGGYGSTIERALSISAIRRDLEAAKDHSARIYHIIQHYQDVCQSSGQPHPSSLEAHLRDFTEAVDRSHRSTEALRACQQVFQDISTKESAEQQQYAHKMSIGHGSDYGGDDGQGYGDDARSNGSQLPDQKKVRRGRAAPPGRCHSCHRAETPEWRRGPDGARTLCNACGLHYAKLTRKLSKNSIGSSSMAGRKQPNSPLP